MFRSNDSFQKETLKSIKEELSFNASSQEIKTKQRFFAEKEVFKFDEKKEEILHQDPVRLKLNILKRLKIRLKMKAVLKFNKNSYNDPILFI